MTEVFPFEIIQARDRVLILFEKDYAVSHIWTDGENFPGIRIPPTWGNPLASGMGTHS